MSSANRKLKLSTLPCSGVYFQETKAGEDNVLTKTTSNDSNIDNKQELDTRQNDEPDTNTSNQDVKGAAADLRDQELDTIDRDSDEQSDKQSDKLLDKESENLSDHESGKESGKESDKLLDKLSDKNDVDDVSEATTPRSSTPIQGDGPNAVEI